jgi:hypothetical protein
VTVVKHEVPRKLFDSPEQRSRRARHVTERSASVRDQIRPRTDHVVSPEQPWLRLARTCINPFPAMPAWGPQVGWVWRVLLTATSRCCSRSQVYTKFIQQRDGGGTAPR